MDNANLPALPARGDHPEPDPTLVLDLIEAFRWSKTMFVAVSLGVFDGLADGPRSAGDLASVTGANADALGRLLDACVGLGLLQRDGGRYANTPVAAAYLTQTSPHRLTGYIRRSNDVLWKLWSTLEDALREGTHRWTQHYGTEGPIFSHFFRTEEAKHEFLMGMHGFGVLSAPHVVRAFDLARFTRFVDLGGATGYLAIAACQRYPHLRAVVFDLPEVVPMAREVTGASNVADRIEIVAGDFFVDPLPPGNIYGLGRILHDWTEDKILALLGRIHAALPPGGAMLVVEKLLSDDRSGPRWAHMQDLNMLVCTEGRERSAAQYAELLTRAGFTEIVAQRTSAPLDAILAVK